MKINNLAVALVGVFIFAVALTLFPAERIAAQGQTPVPTPAQSVPPIPMILAGFAEGAPDGYSLIARITHGVVVYETQPSIIEDGKYLLTVAPPHSGFINGEVVISLEGVEAFERISHSPGASHFNFNVTFPEIPVATLTPTPVPVLPATYSGTITIAGVAVNENMSLVARIGNYTSPPAVILETGEFINLVILTEDESLIGAPVEFFLNGEPSTPPALGVFEPGERLYVDLIFGSVPPTETPTPTETPVPTATPVPTDTPTPVPPTATPVPTDTPTPVPPTATPVPTDTPTPVPPTATPEPTATAVPTNTAVPVVEAEGEDDESSGGCLIASRITFGQAAANMLMLFAPLAMLGGAKYARRRKE